MATHLDHLSPVMTVHRDLNHHHPPLVTTTSKRTTSNNHFRSDRGGLRAQDNRQTGQPNINQLPSSIIHFQSDRGRLRVQDNRQAGQSTTLITHLVIHFNHFQSDRGGLRAQDNRQTGQPNINQPPSSTSSNHFNQPLQPTTSTNHFNQPLQPTTSTTSSLTVAAFGFRTIGRPVNQTSINHHHPSSIIHHPSSIIHHPSSSLTVAGFGFRTIGRLVNQPPTIHFNQPSVLTTFHHGPSNNHDHSPPCPLSTIHHRPRQQFSPTGLSSTKQSLMTTILAFDLASHPPGNIQKSSITSIHDNLSTLTSTSTSKTTLAFFLASHPPKEHPKNNTHKHP
ncbi:hypothetical protein N7447_002977 [Penicillium robsamsonii]|uniref:uncharacterized protein n=1 Tax=Penicillium robsamsonii TaxID=1792511 RepID=UPI002546624D|nr:uncharacterized protein N7447_002977 [Penicillium robsamsonii]KAJ5836951.1 hypothetical protein N7447_002977 [Penicillium robsamsonii]